MAFVLKTRFCREPIGLLEFDRAQVSANGGAPSEMQAQVCRDVKIDKRRAFFPLNF